MNYAIIDPNNNIINIIVVEDENFIKDYILTLGPGFKIVSYDSNNPAMPGGTYMNISNKDIFIAPQPYPSWTLNENYKWIAPVECPKDNNLYGWNEQEKKWDYIRPL